MGRLWSVVCGVVALLVAGCGSGGAGNRGFAPQAGDLLFQDLDSGPLCDAIEAVTTGYQGALFSHVGIVANAEGQTVVIEATSSGVRATPLEAFLARSVDARGQPKVAVGRLRRDLRPLIPVAVQEAQAVIGRPYDKAFAVDNDAYYCSELVYEVFRRAACGRAVFDLEPMTFKDPETGRILPAWEDYFADLGIAVPQGRPGINPGAISRSRDLAIVHWYGARTRSEKGGSR